MANIRPSGNEIDERRDREVARTSFIDSFDNALDDITINWGSLDQAGKIDAIRFALIMVMKVVRFFMKREI